LLVGPAQTLAAHVRATADESLLHVLTQLPRSLQATWGASSRLEVPMLAIRKTAGLVTRPAHQLRSTRSRSASS
jgi:hypothetical protein